MEIFGLLLSIPGAFFISVIFRFILVRADPHYPWIRRVVRPISVAILGMLVVELLAFATVGPRRAQELAGPVFEVVRFLVFFLAMPALVALIVFWRPSKWYVVGPIGAIFAMGLIALQFQVSDEIYGEKIERPYRS